MSAAILATAPSPALIETLHGRTWWRCGNCKRTLAELTDAAVIVKTGAQIIRLPRMPGISQPCPRCGCESMLNTTVCYTVGQT